MFLAWLLREVCSFRDAEQYGQLTRKEGSDLRLARHDSRPVVRKPGQIILPVLGIIMNILFFGIPWAYLAHIEDTTKFKGRLEYMQNNWECYINRLVREYSHFLLIVSSFAATRIAETLLANIEITSQPCYSREFPSTSLYLAPFKAHTSVRRSVSWRSRTSTKWPVLVLRSLRSPLLVASSSVSFQSGNTK